jgi:hypothetical protein
VDAPSEDVKTEETAVAKADDAKEKVRNVKKIVAIMVICGPIRLVL